jgi:hypothetical protein
MSPAASTVPVRRFPALVAVILSVAIMVGAFYGKLRANTHGENFNIAQALLAGKGFANAVGAETGPTAWCAPVYPSIVAGLLWLGEGEREVLVAGLVVLQVCVLMATGCLVLGLVRQTTGSIGASLAAAIFLLGLVYDFWLWFQLVHDCWLMLLALDLVIAGACWLPWQQSAKAAALWGLIGGLCALANPIVGFTWGTLTLLRAFGGWSRPALALFVAGLVLTPWIIRNYVVFGRFIPVKANLAFELYQSQCLLPDGLLQTTAWSTHPSNAGSLERHEYTTLGETAYLERKWQQFSEAVAKDPEDFCERVASRFLGATVWYVPSNRALAAAEPWALWGKRLAHPLPFLALLILIYTSVREPLPWGQWTVISVYLLYLPPYSVVSYYDRYAAPLVAVKALLVIWAVDRLLSLRRA